MSDKIISCIEEEYSFCLSYLWRRRDGWRPLFMYFRGPGGVPFFIAPFLTLVGLWRFARRPQRLIDANTAEFRDATVTRTCSYLGSYGMGGPGFVGLKLKLSSGRRIWVVFTIWAADGWLTVDDDLLADGYFADDKQKLADTRKFRPLADLVGTTLTEIRLEHDIAELRFNDAAIPMTLRLQRDSSSLPVHRGSKRPKMLALSQDIRDAVIISRRAALWLED
jgi:hypothetical protein